LENSHHVPVQFSWWLTKILLKSQNARHPQILAFILLMYRYHHRYYKV